MSGRVLVQDDFRKWSIEERAPLLVSDASSSVEQHVCRKANDARLYGERVRGIGCLNSVVR